MRVRTSWIGLMMLTVACGDPDGRPGGGWDRPPHDGMTLDDLACNRNGDCPEDDANLPPNPSFPVSTDDIGDDEAVEELEEVRTDADNLDPPRGPAEPDEESEDPSPSPAQGEEASDSTEDLGGTNPAADPDEGEGVDPSPEPDGDGNAQPRGLPDAEADDDADGRAGRSDDPPAPGDAAADGEAAHGQEGPGDDAAGDPDAERPEGDAREGDSGRRDDDCREPCDFNADCPSGQPLCVYGRCFAEEDVPFEP